MTDFPRDWRAFKKWREAQKFGPDMDTRAQLVENDLRMLPQLDPIINPNTLAAVEKNISDFEARLKARG